jgi:hypothetical protein
MTTTTKSRHTTAADLRAERARLEVERPALTGIEAIRAMGGRREPRHDGGPLHGVRMEYDGSVYGLPGIAHADQAAARLREIDERLAEIDAAMPEAEAAEQEAQVRAQQEDERRRAQRHRDAVEAVGAAVARVQAAREAEQEARATLAQAIAASPLGALLGTRQASAQARNGVAHALARAGAEEAQARVLDALGDDARRALPALHSNARPPAKPQPHEYDWLIDALLNLPQLQAANDTLTKGR